MAANGATLPQKATQPGIESVDMFVRCETISLETLMNSLERDKANDCWDDRSCHTQAEAFPWHESFFLPV